MELFVFPLLKLTCTWSPKAIQDTGHRITQFVFVWNASRWNSEKPCGIVTRTLIRESSWGEVHYPLTWLAAALHGNTKPHFSFCRNGMSLPSTYLIRLLQWSNEIKLQKRFWKPDVLWDIGISTTKFHYPGIIMAKELKHNITTSIYNNLSLPNVKSIILYNLLSPIYINWGILEIIPYS